MILRSLRFFFLSTCSTYLIQDSIYMLKSVFTRAPCCAGVAVPYLGFLCPLKPNKKIMETEFGGKKKVVLILSRQRRNMQQARASTAPTSPFTPHPYHEESGGLYKMRAHSQGEGMRKKVVRTLSSSLVLFQNKMIMGWCQVTPAIGSITLLPSFCNANREELPLVVFEVSCKGEHQTQGVINIELKDRSKLSYRQQMRIS